MKRLLSLLLLITSLSSCVTNYYVVRHADRLNNTDNSPLSTAGHTRAGALRDSLLTKGIDSIFATQYIRTQQTADSLAIALNQPIIIYRYDTTTAFIKRLKKINGKSVLVVGHSDTAPQIVLELSGQSVPAIAHDDFDNLYIIRKRKCLNTRITLRHITYGVPSP